MNICDSFVVPYVDDIIIISQTAGDHLQHLNYVFDKLSNAGATLRLRKCEFAKAKVNFVGHNISARGIEMDADRVGVILNFKRPNNIKSLRAFLGLINYDHRFVNNYASLTTPLYRLLRKATKWQWETEEQDAFERIKMAFSNVVKLSHPHSDWRYYIRIDASHYAVGSCLYQLDEQQNVNVVAYYSRLLKGAELQYSVTEKETLAIIFFALKKWRILVLGHDVTIVTDHKALVFLNSCRLLSSRLTRWSLYLQEFNLQIEYCKGRENVIADILSRFPDGENPMIDKPVLENVEINAISKNKFSDSIVINSEKLRNDQKGDPFCNRILNQLHDIDGKVSERTKNWFMTYKELLFRKPNVNEAMYRLCVPKNQVVDIVLAEHNNNGHFGAEKCYEILKRNFYWPRFQGTIRKIVGSCKLCQMSKVSSKCHGPMQSVMPKAPNEILSIDFMGPLPRSRGGSVLFVSLC